MTTSIKITASETKVFDRSLLRHRRNRIAGNLQKYSFLIDRTMDDLLDRLSDIKRTFPKVLKIGSRTSDIHDKELQARNGAKHLVQTDISENMLSGKSGLRVQTDEEILPFADNSFNLVISALDLHTVNDLPGTMTQIRRILKPDGLFLAAMLGGETLYELRNAMTQAELNLKGNATPHIAPFADKQQIGGLLQRAGFALPVVDSDIITVTYDNILKLMHDLRGMGEGNIIEARSNIPTGKAMIEETAKIYQEQYAAPDGKITSTFEIIFMIGWEHHESQQKPLRPGSAEHSLAETLGTEELGTGEKATP